MVPGSASTGWMGRHVAKGSGFAAVVWLVCVVSACPSTSAVAPTGSADSSTAPDNAKRDSARYLDHWTSVATAVCKHEATCGVRSSRHLDDCVEDYRSDEGLVAGLSPFFRAEIADSLDAGRFVLRADTGSASCLRDIEQASCDDLGGFPLSCSAAIVGNVPIGGACASSLECKDAGYCAGARRCESMGSCHARAGEGESCATDVPCAKGLVCLASRCQKSHELNEDCSDNGSCKEGFCDTTTKRCRPPHGVGERCNSYEPCLQNLHCKGGVCAERFPGRNEGEACDEHENHCAHQRGFYCRAGACARAGDEGAACATLAGCVRPYRCTEGTCQPDPGVGEPCDSKLDQCRLGTFCDPGSSRCTLTRELGASCLESYECKSHRCELRRDSSGTGVSGVEPQKTMGVCACNSLM